MASSLCIIARRCSRCCRRPATDAFLSHRPSFLCCPYSNDRTDVSSFPLSPQRDFNLRLLHKAANCAKGRAWVAVIADAEFEFPGRRLPPARALPQRFENALRAVMIRRASWRAGAQQQCGGRSSQQRPLAGERAAPPAPRRQRPRRCISTAHACRAVSRPLGSSAGSRTCCLMHIISTVAAAAAGTTSPVVRRSP